MGKIRDPAEYVDAENLFGYVRSWPLRMLDPSGLASVGACSGINSPRNYVRDALHRLKNCKGGDLGLICDRALCEQSECGIDPFVYTGEQNLILDSKRKLDAEAAGKSGSAGALCKNGSRTQVHVLMISPKTQTTPADAFDNPGTGGAGHRHGCCDIDFTTVFDPYDPVDNQELLAREWDPFKRTIIWSRYGTVVPINAGSGGGLFGRHDLLNYLRCGVHPKREWDPNSGHAFPWRNKSDFLELPDMIEAMANQEGILLVCHSQGCNILMERLKKGCVPCATSK